MQGFLVTTASLVCMAYALPQDYTYTPKDSETYVYDPKESAETYVYDPNTPAAYSYSYDQSQATPEKDQKYVFNYDSSKDKYAYKYDASKNSYKYAYDPAKDGQEFNLDSLTELTDSLNQITGSKLFTDTLGDCPLLTEIPEALADFNNVIKGRSGELNSAFRGLQATGRSGISQPGATVRQLGSAIGAIEPLVPAITSLFTIDSSCGATENRKKRQASSMCDNPSELSRDVFIGLADLMDLTVELSAKNPGRAANELNTNDIKEQADLIRDGADLLEEIDLTPLFGALTFNTDCPTNLDELKTSIDDLADLVDIVAPEPQTRVAASSFRAAPQVVQPYRQPAYVQRPGYAVVPQVYYG